MIEIVIPGDPDYIGACITDESRPDPSHAWSRAANHIRNCLGFPFFVRVEASTTCRHVVEEILKKPRPPRRSPVQWGWGKGWPGQTKGRKT